MKKKDNATQYATYHALLPESLQREIETIASSVMDLQCKLGLGKDAYIQFILPIKNRLFELAENIGQEVADGYAAAESR